MRMMRFSYKKTHAPGKDLVAADTLSRQPLPHRDSTELEEVACYVRSVIANLPSTDKRLAEIGEKQAEDPICTNLSNYCNDGGPNRKGLLLFDCRDYWLHRSDIAVEDGLLEMQIIEIFSYIW